MAKSKRYFRSHPPAPRNISCCPPLCPDQRTASAPAFFRPATRATESRSTLPHSAARTCDSPGENRELRRRYAASGRPTPRIAVRLPQVALLPLVPQSVAARFQLRCTKHQSGAPRSVPFSYLWIPLLRFSCAAAPESDASVLIFSAVQPLRIYPHVSDFPHRIFEDSRAK